MKKRLSIYVTTTLLVIFGILFANWRLRTPRNLEAAILSDTIAPKLLIQCSRGAPTADSFWTPKASDLAQFEVALAAFLKTGKAKLSLPRSEYHVQFIGIVSKGRRLIYANFFEKSFVREDVDTSEIPIIVCDGGDSFWGIVFGV